ncbi:hypothetical protein M2150_002005 [Lachnospiraceae bacterium PM6-15]|uniref:Polysaccharide pyruvyl transferase family protein n=1 Tax=Ohessyouella blattaphilus TaxID=2949333 RepID=A0ABT1EFK4_9FIRM|nr:polysaccharide pyruvyl transferase family protein [Ohessyouella blattaphilus]MCP1109490.1 polysaccharide pyruvyl transferase family protein [Ohessyouella blattaphilus]MCR8562884.1 polysaccharide pyruvyl transferase family protein [Ohessyouella blattaphilus]
MKRVGIITLTGERNYGNKLQNYAMEQVLISLGYKVETIRVLSKAENSKLYKEILIRNNVQYMFRLLLKGKRRNRVIRKARFLTFNKNLHQASFSIGIEMGEAEIRKKLNRYDFLVYGSDQIWNPNFSTFSQIYLGEYAKMEKNIAICASFGIEQLSDESVVKFKKGLKNFRAISVREDAGKRIIEELGIQTPISVLVDPTLMLSPDSWGEVESEIETPENYFVKYFLGNPCTKELTVISQIASERRASIVDIGREACLGPSDFLSYIHHASCVCTDSYHAVVFALLFGKEVYVFQRVDKYDSMNSRMQTLFKKLPCKLERAESYIHVSAAEAKSESLKGYIKVEREKFKKFILINL